MSCLQKKDLWRLTSTLYNPIPNNVIPRPDMFNGVITSWKMIVDKKIVPTSLNTPAIERVTTEVR